MKSQKITTYITGVVVLLALIFLFVLLDVLPGDSEEEIAVNEPEQEEMVEVNTQDEPKVLPVATIPLPQVATSTLLDLGRTHGLGIRFDELDGGSATQKDIFFGETSKSATLYAHNAAPYRPDGYIVGLVFFDEQDTGNVIIASVAENTDTQEEGDYVLIDMIDALFLAPDVDPAWIIDIRTQYSVENNEVAYTLLLDAEKIDEGIPEEITFSVSADQGGVFSL